MAVAFVPAHKEQIGNDLNSKTNNCFRTYGKKQVQSFVTSLIFVMVQINFSWNSKRSSCLQFHCSVQAVSFEIPFLLYFLQTTVNNDSNQSIKRFCFKGYMFCLPNQAQIKIIINRHSKLKRETITNYHVFLFPLYIPTDLK